jgi:twitching motility protein PilI
MANREGLRQLQARLATRLEAAQYGPSATSWLAVQAGGANYLLPLAQSGEIFSLASVHAVPHTKTWFCGVLNLRGSVYSVVHLAAFLAARGAARHDAAPGEGVSAITLNPSLELHCALQVDALCGLRDPEVFSVPDAITTDAASCLGRRFMDADGVAWQEIDLRVLAQSPEFLDIRAA